MMMMIYEIEQKILNPNKSKPSTSEVFWFNKAKKPRFFEAIYSPDFLTENKTPQKRIINSTHTYIGISLNFTNKHTLHKYE